MNAVDMQQYPDDGAAAMLEAAQAMCFMASQAVVNERSSSNNSAASVMNSENTIRDESERSIVSMYDGLSADPQRDDDSSDCTTRLAKLIMDIIVAPNKDEKVVKGDVDHIILLAELRDLLQSLRVKTVDDLRAIDSETLAQQMQHTPACSLNHHVTRRRSNTITDRYLRSSTYQTKILSLLEYLHDDHNSNLCRLDHNGQEVPISMDDVVRTCLDRRQTTDTKKYDGFAPAVSTTVSTKSNLSHRSAVNHMIAGESHYDETGTDNFVREGDTETEGESLEREEVNTVNTDSVATYYSESAPLQSGLPRHQLVSNHRVPLDSTASTPMKETSGESDDAGTISAMAMGKSETCRHQLLLCSDTPNKAPQPSVQSQTKVVSNKKSQKTPKSPKKEQNQAPARKSLPKKRVLAGARKTKVATIATSSKRKKGKDETKFEKPPRRLSAYNYFFKYQRERILRLGQGTGGFATLAKTVSNLWKQTSDEEKKPFQELAKLDSLRYEKEYEQRRAEFHNGLKEPETNPTKKPTVASLPQVVSSATKKEEEKKQKSLGLKEPGTNPPKKPAAVPPPKKPVAILAKEVFPPATKQEQEKKQKSQQVREQVCPSLTEFTTVVSSFYDTSSGMNSPGSPASAVPKISDVGTTSVLPAETSRKVAKKTASITKGFIPIAPKRSPVLVSPVIGFESEGSVGETRAGPSVTMEEVAAPDSADSSVFKISKKQGEAKVEVDDEVDGDRKKEPEESKFESNDMITGHAPFHGEDQEHENEKEEEEFSGKKRKLTRTRNASWKMRQLLQSTWKGSRSVGNFLETEEKQTTSSPQLQTKSKSLRTIDAAQDEAARKEEDSQLSKSNRTQTAAQSKPESKRRRKKQTTTESKTQTSAKPDISNSAEGSLPTEIRTTSKRVAGKRKASTLESEGKKPPQRLTAYNYFFQSYRAKLMTSGGDVQNYLELAHLVASLWKNASAQERAPFQKMAQYEKEMYEIQVEDHGGEKDEEEEEETSTGKRRKLSPTRNASMPPKEQSLTGIDASNDTNDAKGSQSAAQSKPKSKAYAKKQTRAKSKTQTKTKSVVQKSDDTDSPKKNFSKLSFPIVTRARKKAATPELELKKPQRRLTAYNYFFQDHRAKLVNREGGVGSFVQLARSVACAWKNASVEERAWFEKLARKDASRYNKEMAEWEKAVEYCER